MELAEPPAAAHSVPPAQHLPRMRPGRATGPAAGMPTLPFNPEPGASGCLAQRNYPYSDVVPPVDGVDWWVVCTHSPDAARPIDAVGAAVMATTTATAAVATRGNSSKLESMCAAALNPDLRGVLAGLQLEAPPQSRIKGSVGRVWHLPQLRLRSSCTCASTVSTRQSSSTSSSSSTPPCMLVLLPAVPDLLWCHAVLCHVVLCWTHVLTGTTNTTTDLSEQVRQAVLHQHQP